MATTRLTRLDTAFLALESPDTPMHLGALAVFAPDRPVPAAALVDLLCARARRVPALRRRVTGALLPPGSHRWTEDPRFDPREHVHVRRLYRGGALAPVAAELMAEPLDLDRPLWRVHVLTGLPGRGFAVLLTVHHALADGLRAVRLGLGLLDGYGDAVAPAGAEPGLWDLARLGCPWWLARRIASAASGLPGAAGIAASVLANLRPNLPESPLASGTPGGRGLAFLQLDLSAVREVRGRFGGTDHDVLLAVLSGALRGWLTQRGYRPDGLDVRALVPVSRRTDSGHGNVLSGYLCPLPVRERDPGAALAEVRAVMGRAKAAGPGRGPGAFPLLTDAVPAVLYRALAPVVRHGARRLFDTVVTTVPVPGLPLTLAGAPLREVYPIAPLAPGHALGVALSTHRGTVHIGLSGRGSAVPELGRLADAILVALDRLRASARPALSAA